MNNTIEAFIKFERESNLFYYEHYAVPLWEVSRGKIYHMWRHKMDKTIPTKSSNIYEKLFEGMICYMQNSKDIAKIKNINTDILILNHPRRKFQGGYFIDIYTDPILDSLDNNYYVLEQSYNLIHKKPVKDERLLYLDGIEFPGLFYGYYYQYVFFYNSEPIHELSLLISKKFQLDYKKVKSVISRNSARFYYYYKKIVRLIDEVNPKVLVIVPHYTTINRAFTFVAHKRNIPVVELQHGTISPYHVQYNLSEKKLKTFPDFIFLWGDNWKNKIRFPLDKDKLISVGYPYLEQNKIVKQTTKNKTNKILFLSQWTIGEKLMNWALRLALKRPDIQILFKLHPREYDQAKHTYKNLGKLKNVEIITDTPSLYDLFRQSSIQVGVYSTALIEGVMFDLPTIVLMLPGWKFYESFKEDANFKFVDSMDSLNDAIENHLGKSIKANNNYFKKNSIFNIKEMIDKIVKK
jgi:hypothetical protein